MTWTRVAMLFLILAPARFSAEVVECPDGNVWAGSDIARCPCCEACADGGWVIRGEEVCSEPSAEERRAKEKAARKKQEAIAAKRRVDEYIDQKCHRDDPGHGSSYRYCKERQTEGHASFLATLRVAESEKTRNAMAGCLLRWAGADFFKANWAQAAYCAERELERHGR